MKYIFSSLLLFSLFFIGCSTTPPIKKTNVRTIEPINKSVSKENIDKNPRVVIETNNNITRIYTKKGE